jgi:S-adenosylmethionine:tRNA ribosyltransferase-isomerase
MTPEKIFIKDFIYELPPELIAKYPLEERDISKLLIYKEGEIKEDLYLNIAHYLPAESLLIFNDTKVVQARIFFYTSKGDKIEIFCLEPVYENNIALAMASTGKVQWKCLVGKAAKWKEKTIHFSNEKISIEAEIADRKTGFFIIEFRWKPDKLSFAEVLHYAGMMPIPPYLKRTTEEIDLQRYQTLYAREEGSVAAPTAGLHFTKRIFDTLKTKNIQTCYVTLHVGAGTFKPVKASVMAEHEMHSEFIDVHIDSLRKIASALDKPIIVVGTTSLRTIETIYWLGVKILGDKIPTMEIPELKQWEPYSLSETSVSPAEALKAVIDWLENKKQQRLLCKTSLLIVPGYKLKLVDALITNFHQPESTLILLVATVMGKDWRSVYNYALANKFRFLSYGDGSLLFTNKNDSILTFGD